MNLARYLVSYRHWVLVAKKKIAFISKALMYF